MANYDSEFIFFEVDAKQISEKDINEDNYEDNNKDNKEDKFDSDSEINNNNLEKKNKIKKTFKINFSSNGYRCYSIDKSNKDKIIVQNINFKHLINELNKNFNSLPENKKNKDDIFFFNFFIMSYLILLIINLFGIIINKLE